MSAKLSLWQAFHMRYSEGCTKTLTFKSRFLSIWWCMATHSKQSRVRNVQELQNNTSRSFWFLQLPVTSAYKNNYPKSYISLTFLSYIQLHYQVRRLSIYNYPVIFKIPCSKHTTFLYHYTFLLFKHEGACIHKLYTKRGKENLTSTWRTSDGE